jgi:hypothetical protein
MNRIIDAIIDLFSTLVKLSLTGFAIALIAGEVRLAALKKLSKGSPRLLSFSERMTGERLPF